MPLISLVRVSDTLLRYSWFRIVNFWKSSKKIRWLVWRASQLLPNQRWKILEISETSIEVDFWESKLKNFFKFKVLKLSEQTFHNRNRSIWRNFWKAFSEKRFQWFSWGSRTSSELLVNLRTIAFWSGLVAEQIRCYTLSDTHAIRGIRLNKLFWARALRARQLSTAS